MNRKLISVLGATVLSLAALPWTAQSAPVTQRAIGNPPVRPVAGSLQASGHQASDLGGISPEVLSLALRAVQCGVASGDLQAPPTLTVIDYSRPSVEPRLWVFDLTTGKLLFKELVAHGRNTGENMATQLLRRDEQPPVEPGPVRHVRHLRRQQRLFAAARRPGARLQRPRPRARDRDARRALRGREAGGRRRAGSAAAGAAPRCARRWRATSSTRSAAAA